MSPTQPTLPTPATLATLGGLATAVLVIVDSIHVATGWTTTWFALVLSVALALVVEFTLSRTSAGRPRIARVTLALINGCLVFTTALGGNQMGTRTAAPREEQPHASLQPSSSAAEKAHRPFFHDWLQPNRR
jgi:hypothetical protein